MMILNVLQELLERRRTAQMRFKTVYGFCSSPEFYIRKTRCFICRQHKEGCELGDNIQSKVLAFAFGLSAEIERTLLSERTKQGLERARKEGKQIGRLKGQQSKYYKLSGKAAFIRRSRLTGRSKLSLAHELGVTWATAGGRQRCLTKITSFPSARDFAHRKTRVLRHGVCKKA